MGYRMQKGSTLTESIFEDVKRRFSSEMLTFGDTQSFARAIFNLNSLSLALTSFPEEVREVIYNGVVRTSSVLSPEDIGSIWFG
jgi:hypothetical protein